MNLIHRLVEQHKFFRRLVLIWSMTLITWVVFQVFAEPSTITAASATALATIVGLLATAIAFYNYSRHQEQNK